MIETFGQLLTEWRWLRDLSQGQLSRACGVDSTHIGRLEKDERNPGPEMVARLADALELRPRERTLFYLMAGLAPPNWREIFGMTHLRQIGDAEIPRRQPGRTLRRIV